jgi:fibronectin type 3 domain-containing protein
MKKIVAYFAIVSLLAQLLPVTVLAAIEGGSTVVTSILQEDDPGISYSGWWVPDEDSKYSGGRANFTKDHRASLEFTFTGSGFRYIGTKTKNNEELYIYIDDQLAGEVKPDASKAAYQQVIYEVNNLNYGTHKAEIRLRKKGEERDRFPWQAAPSVPSSISESVYGLLDSSQLQWPVQSDWFDDDRIQEELEKFMNSLPKLRELFAKHKESLISLFSMNVDSIQILSALPAKPSVPAAPAASYANDVVTVNWTSVPNAAGFKVYRSTKSKGSAEFVSAPVMGETEFIDPLDGISRDKDIRFYYTVTALGADGFETARSKEVSVTVPKYNVPAPTGLTASVNDQIATLQWNTVPGASEYRVYRIPAGSTGYKLISASGAVKQNSYVDLSLSQEKFIADTTYSYAVTAIRGGKESGKSIPVSALFPKTNPIVRPNVPAAPSATYAADVVTVKWTAVPHATGYQVYRSSKSNGMAEFVSGPITEETMFIDPLDGVSRNKDMKLYYTITALGTDGYETAKSKEASVTAPKYNVPAPTELSAIVNEHIASLHWNTVPGASEYKVYRAPSGSPVYELIGSVRQNSFKDISMAQQQFTEDTVLQYAVAAVRGGKDSGKSAPAQALFPKNVIEEINYLMNGDFEELGQQPEVAANWASYIPNGSVGEFQLQADQVSSGQLAQRVKGLSLRKGSMIAVHQQIDFQGGKVFEIRGDIWASSLLGSKIQLYIDFYDANNKWLGLKVKEHSVETNDFVAVSDTGMSPLGTAYAKVYVTLRATSEGASGEFIVDGLKLTDAIKDASGPEMMHSDPQHSETEIMNQTISLTFGENIIPGAAMNQIMLQEQGGEAVPVWLASGINTILIHPVNDLKAKTSYTVIVPAGAVSDLSGNASATGYSFEFRTIETAIVNVLKNMDFEAFALEQGIADAWTHYVSPGANAHWEAVSEPVANGLYAQKMSAGQLARNQVSMLSQKVMIEANAMFYTSAQYYIESLTNAKVQLWVDFYDASNKVIGASIVDYTAPTERFVRLEKAGIAPAGTKHAIVNHIIRALDDHAEGSIVVDAAAFKLATKRDIEPPQVSRVSPAANATQVAVNTPISITFSEGVSPAEHFGNIALKQGSDTVPVIVTIDHNQVVISPSTALQEGKLYTVIIPAKSVQDLAGNSLSDEFRSTFTTVLAIKTNMLKNGSFETVSTGSGTGDGWSIVNGTGTAVGFELVSSPVHTGVKSQKVIVNQASNWSIAGVNQRITVTPNSQFIISGYFAPEKLDQARVELYVDYYNASNQYLTTVRQVLTTQTSEMTEVSLTGTTHSDARFATVYAFVRATADKGSAVVYIDSLQYNEILQENVNLLTNPSFEANKSSTTIPDGWRENNTSGQAMSYEQVASPAAHEANAQKISVSAIPSGKYAAIYQRVPVQQNQTIRFSSLVFAETLVNARVELYMDFYNAQNQYVSTKSVTMAAATAGYVPLSMTETIPAGATSVVAYLMIRAFNGEGTAVVYFDDVRINTEALNYVRNGSFETIVNGSPKDWYSIAPKEALLLSELVYAPVTTGYSANKVKVEGLSSGKNAAIFQQINVEPGKAFQASVDLHVVQLNNARIELYIDFMNESNQYVGVSQTILQTVNTQYSNVFATGTTPAEAKIAKLYILIRGMGPEGSGSFYADTVKFNQ